MKTHKWIFRDAQLRASCGVKNIPQSRLTGFPLFVDCKRCKKLRLVG